MSKDDIPSPSTPEGARNCDQIETLKDHWHKLVGWGSESVPVAITADRRLIVGCSDARVAEDLRSRERFLLTAVKQIIPIDGLRFRVPGQERTPTKTQAERFDDFMAASRPPIATGTVRRFLDEHALEVTADVVRFRDGSEIQRADGSLAPEPPKRSRGMGR
jgi:hypothetical protein